MTPEESFALHRKVVNAIAVKNASSIDLGLYLSEVKRTKAYKGISGEGTFTDYLSSPEVKMSISTAHRYVRIAEKFVLELGIDKKRLDGLDTLMLYLACKVVTKENVEEWITRIETLSRSDILHLLKYGEADAMTCTHDYETIPMRFRCKHCGAVTNHL